MPETIVLEFSGDCWNNPTRFSEQLNQIPLGESIILDMRSEGPSLQALGVCNVVDQWLLQRQQSPDTVELRRWSNPTELVPYKLFECSNPSHFFFMSKDYWVDHLVEFNPDYRRLFGLFLGRMTFARAVILYQCFVPTQSIFISKMASQTPYPWQLKSFEAKNLDCLSDWLSTNEQYRMFEWFDQCTIPSIDQKSVRDQYATPASYADTNRSLLDYYHEFAVEIVCETYTMGDTFFPTEKTIRPIMATKPFVVYGPKYFLARLRSMGFKTYSDLWDESYDLCQGPQRWKLMQKTMQSIKDQSKEQQIELLAKAHDIALHNRQRLHDIVTYQVELFLHDYKNR